MVKPAQLKRIQLQVSLAIGQSEASDRSEKAGLENHFDIESVLHSLKVICRVLHNHVEALLHAQVVVVDRLEECAADAKFLIRRQDEHLRDGQRRLWHFMEFIESGRVGYELVVHVNEEVVPEFVERDARGALDVELENGLQMPIQMLREVYLLGFHSVDFEDFGDSGWITCFVFALLHFAFGPLNNHGSVEATEETVRLLDFNLAGELGDKFAERAEFLVLVTHNLNERVPISQQAYQQQKSNQI